MPYGLADFEVTAYKNRQLLKKETVLINSKKGAV
jgi:hypothetical protein